MRWILVVFGPAAVLLCGAAVVAWWYREAPASDWFGALTGTVGLGAGVMALAIAVDLPRALLLATVVVVGLAMPVPWLFFCLSYTGRDEFVSPGMVFVVSIVPAVGLLATAVVFGTQTLSYIRLPSQEAASGLAAAAVAFLNITQWLSLLYASGLVVVGTGLLLWAFHRYEYLDSTIGLLLGVLGTVPWLAILFGLQLDGTAPWVLSRTVGVGLFVGSASASAVLGPYRLFDRLPAAGNVGPQTVVEELSDLVIVTDSTGSVVELNAAAERALPGSVASVVGTDIADLFGTQITALGETETVRLSSVDGYTLFEPTISELTDQHGHSLGHAIVLRDVTERTSRRQRLEVFNRVLRHNLRNKMTVVISHAERLRATVDDPSKADSAGAIVDAGEDLTRLSEQAREIERVISDFGSVGGTATLDEIVESIFADIGQPDVSLTHDVPAGVIIEGSGTALELALSNLVDNAVEHNDESEPTVTVRASYEADRQYPLFISVADNGPGIPDHEVQAVEEGSESALEHGSGLGLWAVRWVVMRLGGEVAFRDRDPRGTLVAVRLGDGVRQDPDRQSATPDNRVTRS